MRPFSKTYDLRGAISNLMNIFFPGEADQTLLSKHFKYVSCLPSYLLFDFLLLLKHYNSQITSELQLTKYPTKGRNAYFLPLFCWFCFLWVWGLVMHHVLALSYLGARPTPSIQATAKVSWETNVLIKEPAHPHDLNIGESL